MRESVAISAAYAACLTAMVKRPDVLKMLASSGSVWIDAATVSGLINAGGWLMGSLSGSSRAYDATGAVANLAIILSVVNNKSSTNKPLKLISAIAISWVLRLGTFLTLRAARFGDDHRLAKARSSPIMFIVVWVLQMIWNYITLLPIMVVGDSDTDQQEVDQLQLCGSAIAVVGLVTETVADFQKLVFKTNHPTKFISSGLWSLSRHPNYLGEIMLWGGLAISSLPYASGGFRKLLALASPLFVFGLLRYVSGVPILEKQADKKYKDDPAYHEYKRRTSLLVPKL
eukprot:TRINITY_DN14278_c0_g1_i1.p1 TRINITY_DN14278_c0_g1~~TRINITY_DN14278_c0_g1_i1.p1  ORF type:complete len:307 (+),score=51.30 TRINITY_DN14278_c0_g1_i1:65-922(+)